MAFVCPRPVGGDVGEPGRDSLALFNSLLVFPSLAVLAHVGCLSGTMDIECGLSGLSDFSARLFLFFFVILSFCHPKAKLHRRVRRWFKPQIARFLLLEQAAGITSLHAKMTFRCFLLTRMDKKKNKFHCQIGYKSLQKSRFDLLWLGIPRALNGISCVSAANQSQPWVQT